mmetsp:Transcript_8903/g.24140  ORF Transcript_8903/g.24140 Transcript_8903/m.24140 type:complete len:223 (-) Transcript_8903:773-1441(-)
MLFRSSFNTVLQTVSALVGSPICRKQAALFSSQVLFSSTVLRFSSSENLSVCASISMTFLYFSNASSNRLFLKSFAPTSLRAAATATFSSLDMLHWSLPFSKSISSMLKTTFSASISERPSRCSRHLDGAVQVTTARSSFFISAAAHSRASQMSPSPQAKYRLFGPQNPGSVLVPSVASSTRSVTIKPSFGCSYPSPSLICFFITDPSFRRETSVVSYISSR